MSVIVVVIICEDASARVAGNAFLQLILWIQFEIDRDAQKSVKGPNLTTNRIEP